MQYDSISQLQHLISDEPGYGTVFVQLTRKTIKTTKTGRPYLEVNLADVASTLTIKVWDNAMWYPAFMALNDEDCIAVTATWQNTPYGIEATDVDIRPLSPEEEHIMMTGGAELAQRQEEDWDCICDLVDSLQDPRLSHLSRALLENFESRFRRAGAARSVHHARRGGLVEHTAGVMRAAAAFCTAYPQLNRDLLLAGALFHDCGKMWENAYPEHGLAMPYSDTGELLGHISLGIEVINKLWTRLLTDERKAAWEDLEPATDQVRLHLLHLVASHHGCLEFGSPVVPKTPEALALNHADNLDAKLEMMRCGYETAPALSTHIRQGKKPLAGNLVTPLAAFESDSTTA
ncbi:MAG: HD domain-containing protein [Akkermansia sp.]|nr:HD domain-containing protein [Akkermansia sp.]